MVCVPTNNVDDVSLYIVISTNSCTNDDCALALDLNSFGYKTGVEVRVILREKNGRLVSVDPDISMSFKRCSSDQIKRVTSIPFQVVVAA